MKRIARQEPLLLVVALAMLAARALMPDGYMPGSRDSGLLFELCPSGMPVAIMRALAGGDYHHHHGDTPAASSAESCPIGHMLSASVAVDSGLTFEIQTATPRFDTEGFDSSESVPESAYRSRAPPA